MNRSFAINYIKSAAISLAALFISWAPLSAQDKFGEQPQECKDRLTEFYEFAKIKNYEYAYDAWFWCFENCPASNKNIYAFGLKIAEDRLEKSGEEEKEAAENLIDKVFEQRIQYFPENLGKVYSDWASSLEKRGASKEAVFEKLEAGYTADPSGLSVKNIAVFFQEVTDRNEATDVQKIFDTYDNLMEAINFKIESYTKALDKINIKEANGEILTNKEYSTQKNNGINLKALGQVETILDMIIGQVATCERLIPLYKKGFDSHKTDAKWLRRAASRLNTKECTDDPIYPVIVEAYVLAEPSPAAFTFITTIYDKRGETKKAEIYRKKAIEEETDPYKKARLLYNMGSSYRRSNPSTAASYARQALKFQPSMGKAYLLIASAYAASANSCGTDEFSKRMVYVAAADKVRKAKAVDPSISSVANKYLKSYTANQPSKQDVFMKSLKSGDSFNIACWIRETVKIP